MYFSAQQHRPRVSEGWRYAKLCLGFFAGQMALNILDVIRPPGAVFDPDFSYSLDLEEVEGVYLSLKGLGLMVYPQVSRFVKKNNTNLLNRGYNTPSFDI